MIRFFRHIRKTLLEKGQMGKYFKYAIGEIILVMLGILLALQVNNWNEGRKLKNTQSLYLKGLKQNLLESKKELNRVINESNVTVNSMNTLVDVLREEGDQINDKELDSLMMMGMAYTKYQTRQGVIDELISSGQVSLIENDYLRAEIASWNANLVDIREVEEMSKSGFYNYLDRLSAYFDFSGITPPDKMFNDELRKRFFNDLKTRNTIANIRATNERLNNAYLEKREQIDTLLQVINKELNLSND